MDIAAELRTAGLTVITGRSGIGRTANVEGIETRITGTGQTHEGALDVNGVVTKSRGVAYVERSGRVWLLADGPVGQEPNAVIFVAAHLEKTITDEQKDAIAAVEAVLTGVYGIGAPKNDDRAGNGD